MAEYDANRVREILREPGHRYKRNMLALSAAVIAVKITGAKLDPSSVPGIAGLSPGWLWGIVTTIILYNIAFFAYHAVQDWKIANDYFHQIHLGFPNVLFSKQEPVNSEPLKEKIEVAGEHTMTIARIFLGRKSVFRMQRVTPDGNTLKLHDGGIGLDIRIEENKALKRMINWFWGGDIIAPISVSVIALVAISFTFLRPAHAEDITPVDGDTFHYGDQKVRVMDIDTPEPTRYGHAECLSEALLGDLASAFTKDIVTTREIEIEFSGKEDKYKRALVKVRVGDEYLGDMLIDAGLAMPWKGRQFDWCK